MEGIIKQAKTRGNGERNKHYGTRGKAKIREKFLASM
jgi:hypothetical protein